MNTEDTQDGDQPREFWGDDGEEKKRRRRIWPFVLLGVLLVVLIGGAFGAYAYDNSRKDEIARGVTVNGIEIGGFSNTEARNVLRHQLLSPLQKPIVVRYRKHHFTLSGHDLRVRANIDDVVDQALAASRDGSFPSRIWREVSGGSVDEQLHASVSYSQPAINEFVQRVARNLNQDPQDASVDPTPASLNVVAGEPGRAVNEAQLTRALNAAAANDTGERTVIARVHETKPEVTTAEVAADYPTYMTLDRSTYQLRFWKDLKLTKTYTVAVGQAGLETPAGLYHILDKQVNPSWHVPDSAWAGSLAGQVIPPGPSDPIKARWMGIFDGAGIHGTDETYSLGHAASHGCVRMAIPDVIDLYDRVDVGTPIYIG